MSGATSIERHLIRILAVIACIAVIGVLVILPFRLYERDVRNARIHAHRISTVVHAAISNSVHDGEDISDLVNRLQGSAALEIRLSKVEKGEVHPVVTSGEGSSELQGTTLRYTAPAIVDRLGDRWLATMEFDLSAMKRESIRLIIDLVLAVFIGSLIFSLAVFLLVRWAIVGPLMDVTRRVERFESEGKPLQLPSFETAEMSKLGAAVERLCDAKGEPPKPPSDEAA